MNDKLKRLRNASTAAEIAGWYGTGAIVLAYILVSFNIVAGGGGRVTSYLILVALSASLLSPAVKKFGNQLFSTSFGLASQL